MRPVALLVLAAALAGCSSGRLSAGEFSKRAALICNDEYGAMAIIRAGPFRGEAERLSLVAELSGKAAAYAAASKRYRALRPPKAIAARYRGWLASRDRELADLRALDRAWDRHDIPRSLRALDAFDRQDERTNPARHGLAWGC